MKIYPKVPHHYHEDVVPADFFTEGELYVTEKVDGGNFRMMLFEDRFRDEYSEDILEMDPVDGEFVFGTQKSIRGTTSDSETSFDGSLRRAFRFLRDEVDREALSSVQDEYGPVVLFCENMAYHTLDYDYDTNPPPALIGFDVCVQRDTEALARPPNPYEQVFEGFLELPEAMAVFERVGIEPIVSSEDVETVSAVEFDVSEFDVPSSRFADVQAEGVVIRKRGSNHRVKLVRDEFKEMNKQLWGLSKGEAENGNEMFVAKYCTNARVEKIITKMVVDEGRELSMELLDDLWPRVVDDIWEEHWRDIKEDRFAFTPADVKPMVASVCRGVLQRKIKNARLNDAPVEETFSR